MVTFEERINKATNRANKDVNDLITFIFMMVGINIVGTIINYIFAKWISDDAVEIMVISGIFCLFVITIPIIFVITNEQGKPFKRKAIIDHIKELYDMEQKDGYLDPEKKETCYKAIVKYYNGQSSKYWDYYKEMMTLYSYL